MSPSSSDVARRHPAGRLLGWTGRVAIIGLLVAVCLGGLAWLILHWGILPRLDHWRPEIAARVSERLGVKVDIGRIQVQSSRWVPAFTLHEVSFSDPLGREALKLPQVATTLSVRALMAGRLRLSQVVVDGARLDVRRDAQRRIWVAGLDVGAGGNPEEGGPPDWLWDIREFAIRGGTLTWTDEARGAPPLTMRDVQLVVRNAGRRHDLRLDATPPADWGGQVQVMVQATRPLLASGALGGPEDWHEWSGTVYADLADVDLSRLREQVALPVDLRQGRASLRTWLDWARAEPRHLTLDVDVQDLSLRLGRGLAPLELERARTRLTAERLDDGARFTLDGLRFTTPSGDDWADSRMAVRWRWSGQPPGLLPLPAPGEGAERADAAHAVGTAASASATSPPWALTGGEIEADRLDLATLAALAERLPLGAPVRQLLARLNPVGTVNDFQGNWSGPLDAPEQYSVAARLVGSAIDAAPSPEPGGLGRPGWRGADVAFKATEAGGTAVLKLADGSLTVPGVFAEPEVPLQRFSADLAWRIEPDARRPGLPDVTLDVRNARYGNADASGRLSAQWRTGPGAGYGQGRRWPGIVKLDGRIDRGQATRVARYLPLGLPQATRQWVQHAVQGGSLHEVDFHVSGDLWAFPFVDQAQGEFKLDARVQGVTLAPVPSVPAHGDEPAWTSPWPGFTDVSGRVHFERDAIRFTGASGRLWNLQLSGVNGGIGELSTQAVVEVAGHVAGPAADVLRYMRETPIDGWTYQALSRASVDGDAALDLKLSVPLADPAGATVRGDLKLQGNSGRIRPDLPRFDNARGPVVFTHRQVTLEGVQAQIAGGLATLRGGTRADGPMRFEVEGVASAEGLRQTPELPVLVTLGEHLAGQAPYQLTLTLGDHQPEFDLRTTLQGVAIRLPAPMAKAAGAQWPLRVRNRVSVDARQAVSDQVDVALDTPAGPMRAKLVRAIGADRVRLSRHAWSFNADLPAALAGGQAAVVFDRLDVGPWQALVEAQRAKAPPDDGAPVVDGVDTPWPGLVHVSAREMNILGRRLTALSADLRRLPGPTARWRAEVIADQTQGSVVYRLADAEQPSGRLTARMARLAVPPAEAERVVSALDEAEQVLPALDLDIGEFQLGDRNFGRLVVEAVNRPDPHGLVGVNQWRLNRLDLQWPGQTARLDASGVWQRLPGQAERRLTVDFRLQVQDAGRLLEQMGFGKALQGGSGELRGTLGWDGSPLSMDIPSLGGGFALQLHKGRFMKADPGAARLLGVLSLQALPRRLILDFRDLFQEGFAFDNASADVRIATGVARTNNLRLRGMHAAALIEGEADIARETQDLHAVVLPELNTVSASLAYAVINPAVGLGALFGQWIFREPLRRAAAREFRITGQWDDPQVERIERAADAPLPTAAAMEPLQGASAPAASASAARLANGAVRALPAAPAANPGPEGPGGAAAPAADARAGQPEGLRSP